VAASLRNRGAIVHVIGPEAVPLGSKLGPQIGAMIQSLHEANGVTFHLGRRAVAYDGGLVRLDDGTTVAAARVVLGIGVTPRLQMAEMAGLRIDRGVLVDASMRTSDPHILAAGDIARFPGALGEPVRIEHWVVAERQGQVAAAAMLNEEDAYVEAPYFWSVHYDVTVRYVGHAEAWDSIDEIGSVALQDAEVRYIKDGKVIAVATINRDLDCLKAAERIPYER
jgi:NADPH-dependent 2,4-dienoyl-CoA reductase/sulfur reductase-like enzyme